MSSSCAHRCMVINALADWAAPVLPQAKLAPKLAQLKALEQKQALLEQGLAQYAENDPERINMLSEPYILLRRRPRSCVHVA